jgi:hypothetical protein
MLRKCTHCAQEKELEKFVRQGHLYRYKCKECLNASLRTGKPHEGRFKKGHPGNTKKGRNVWNKGKTGVFSHETLEEMSRTRKGRRHTEEAKIKIAEAGRKGKSRQSWAYRNWRNLVFIRDGFTCKTCGCKEINKLHPHHILPWEECLEKRFDIDNGITYCISCHAKLEGFQKGHIPWSSGKIFGEEHRNKLSKAKKGKPSSKKGIKTFKPAWNKGLKNHGPTNS